MQRILKLSMFRFLWQFEKLLTFGGSDALSCLLRILSELTTLEVRRAILWKINQDNPAEKGRQEFADTTVQAVVYGQSTKNITAMINFFI